MCKMLHKNAHICFRTKLEHFKMLMRVFNHDITIQASSNSVQVIYSIFSSVRTVCCKEYERGPPSSYVSGWNYGYLSLKKKKKYTDFRQKTQKQDMGE